jgi:hypothetical protein
MIVGLIEIFHLVVFTACVEQILEGADDFRLIEFRLLQKHAGHAQRDFKPSVVSDEFRKHARRGQIALIRNLQKDLPVRRVPKKFVPVRMEAERLMELKI